MVDVRLVAVLLMLVIAVLVCALPAHAATTVVPQGAGLQDAITAAAPGDTLQLQAGDYTTSGYVVIDKALTITGAGRDATVIRNTMSTAGASATTPTTTGWFQVNAPGSLTVNHLTLDGGALRTPAINTGAAVYAQAPLTVDDVHVTNCVRPGYLGIGLILIGSGPHSVNNSLIDGIGRVGVYVGASPGYLPTSPILPPTVQYSAHITNSTFVGAGVGDYCQYGIEVGRSGRALIENCDFSRFSGVASSDGSNSGCVYANSYWGGGVSTTVLKSSLMHDAVYGFVVGYPDQARDTWVDISSTRWDRIDNDLIVEGATTVIRVPHGAGNHVVDAAWTYTWIDQTLTELASPPALCAEFFNRPPVGVPDAFDVQNNKELVTGLGALVSNDVDPDLDVLTAELVTGPTKGTLVLNADGSFSYMPNAGVSGADSFTYRAKDTFGSSDVTLVSLNILADTTAPAAPAALTATAASTSSIALSWTAATDPSGVAKYKVYRSNGTFVAETAGTSYTVSGLAAGTAYSYYVTAVDVPGNEGVPSNTAGATTLSAPAPAPTPTPAPTPVLTPVYRFFSPRSGTHFYTPTASERDHVIATWPDVWSYEGVAYVIDLNKNPQPLYRFYNRGNGSHFYTASDSEANTVMTAYAAVFQYDGRSYPVSPSPEAGKTPVYRFFNLRNGSHFYTASETERDHVIATWPDVYRLEGPAFWLGQ